MGLKYSAHYCSQAQLILKMDDDIAVDLFQLLDLVRSKSLTGLQIAGAVLTGDERNPVRDKASKWYVSRDDYAPSKYPPFVSGWAYVTTVQAASQLVRHSESSPFFLDWRHLRHGNVGSPIRRESRWHPDTFHRFRRPLKMLSAESSNYGCMRLYHRSIRRRRRTGWGVPQTITTLPDRFVPYSNFRRIIRQTQFLCYY